MIESLQAFAQSFPGWAQWLAVALVAAIPFVESYSGTVIGVAIGLHPVAAASAAILGNAAAMIAVVAVTSRIRARVQDAAGPGAPARNPKRRQRLRRTFERFGIPGVALLGHPTQISSGAMVGFGADRTKVVVWELVSIVAWGSLFAVLAGLGVELLLH